MDLLAMVWRFPVMPAKVKVAEVTRRPPGLPRNGGGDDFLINRGQLGSMEALERRHLKFSGEQFAGSEIYRAALARGGRRSGEGGERMEVTVRAGVSIDLTLRFVSWIRRWEQNSHTVG
jgi:hypothetical protein